MRKPLYFFVVSLFICSAAVAGQPGVHEMPGLQPVEQFDRAAYDAEQQRLHAWLVNEQVEAGLLSPASIKLTEKEIAEIESGQCDGCQQSATRALLAGLVKPVDMEFDLKDFTHGAIGRLHDGGLVWTAAVHSDDAAALRLHFSDFSLPEGYELWLYSSNGIVRGPYTGQGPNASGDFWSHTIAGSTAMLQLRGQIVTAAGSRPAFTVDDLGHVGQSATLKSFCSFNATCVENGECYTNTAITAAKNAIAHMQFVERRRLYMCSGGLLNSSINPGTPYFLTANHCISTATVAATMEAFFLFKIDCGSTACPDYNQINVESTLGSSLLATNETSDFTLLQLSQPPPSECAFMGWSTAPVVGTGASIYRISHPAGAPQAYSEHTEWDPNQVPTVLECSGWPRGQWIYTQDQVGATEGGSSGSPVVNAAGQVVGQLSGACGYALSDNCNNIDNSTVDGAFAAYYDQVAPWLGSGGPCTDGDDDGYCEEVDDCDDGDPDVNPGSTEICEDGIDNDCAGGDADCVTCTDDDGDGYCEEDNDCDDSNYSVNPGMTEICGDGIDNDCFGGDEECPTCGEVGDPCTSGTDCCSLRCHPRRLTCK